MPNFISAAIHVDIGYVPLSSCFYLQVDFLTVPLMSHKLLYLKTSEEKTCAVQIDVVNSQDFVKEFNVTILGRLACWPAAYLTKSRVYVPKLHVVIAILVAKQFSSLML